jgi:ubiquitin carboxyl-terminal hydrolase 8
MQVLNHTYELNELLDSDSYVRHLKPTIPDVAIIHEWNDLRKVMWSNNGVVSPNRFVLHVHQLASQKDRDIFTGWAQNDMPEFLLFMIECMHNAISRSVGMRISGNIENSTDKLATECYGMLKQVYGREYSEIMDLFYGIYVSVIESVDGSIAHTMKPESYFMLDLPLVQGGSNTTLYDCMDAFTRGELMEGDNAWLNESTGQKESVMKRITFWNFPKVLVITLKRFSADGENKIADLVQFPLEDLDLSKYVSGYKPTAYKYDLYGVCNHMGGVMGGHYTSFVKNYKNEWIHYNDTHVEVMSSNAPIVSPSAYCLFYRRKNN